MLFLVHSCVSESQGKSFSCVYGLLQGQLKLDELFLSSTSAAGLPMAGANVLLLAHSAGKTGSCLLQYDVCMKRCGEKRKYVL